MRVIHVITRLIVGGAQENTVASVFGLRAKPGMDVSLLAGPSTGPEGSLESAFSRHGEAQLLTLVPELVRPVHPGKDWRAYRRLIRIFRERRPDIVHTHSGKAGVLGRLAAARAGVPIIIHTIHGPSFGAFQGALANGVFRFAEQRAAKVTTHFVAVSEAMIEQYLAAGIGVPNQYSKIYSGFDLNPFLAATNDAQVRARFNIRPADIVIGKIARLFKLKGHDDLFAAAPALARECPQIRFLLVGDGPWRSRIEARAATLGLQDRFAFAGLVPPAEIPRLVGIMDIVAHLSVREGLPRALPQALAAGKPIIAYDCDGAREVCLEGETGFLLSPGDLRGMTERLLRLAREPALRERFGQRGRELVRERFAVERMVEALHELYLRLRAECGKRDA